MLQCGVRWEISLLTTQCVSCLIKDVECMFGIVWPPPNFQHVALSNMQRTCWIVHIYRLAGPSVKWQNIRVRLIARWNIHSSQKQNKSNNKKTSFITFRLNLSLRACLYGLGYPRQPSPRDNFTKRLYENCVTETQLTLLDYAYILRRNKHHHLPLFLCSSSFIKYSCVFTFRKWTNTSIL